MLLLLASPLRAQQEARLRRAHAAYERMEYLIAAQDYEKVLAKRFDKTALLRLADCYRLLHDYRNAAKVYSKVVGLNQIPPINYFYFAQSIMNLGLYPEAAKWFERYAQAVPEDPRGAIFAESCRNVGRFYEDTAEVSISPFPLNSPAEDFSPVWFRDGILFSSSRGAGEVVDRPLERSTPAFLDLYYSKMSGEGEKWTRPSLVKGKLNTRFHEATCGWDSINGLAYFTRNNFFEGKKVANANGVLNLKLFYADVPANGPWTNVRSVPFNSDEWSTGHGAVVLGGEYLVFISDRPGGHGGTDLYVSHRQGDAWSEPRNLGPRFNSPGNEMFPYITHDNQLYFSSDGWGGLGGLDLFTCPLDSSEATAQNLGAPFNTSSDDFGLVMAPSGAWGLFSSNRKGGRGSDDIYIFRYAKPRWNCVVLDAVTRTPVQDAKVSLHLPAQSRVLHTTTDALGQASQLLQRDVTYEVLVEADQYRPLRSQRPTYGVQNGTTLNDTLWLERPSVHVVTKVLDPATGFPIANAQVRVVGTKLTFTTDSTGTVDFYYDPYPELAVVPIDCPPAPDPEYCFEFTDEGFSEFDTLQLTYEWSFGDGTTARGLQVKHCYKAAGLYEVSLNLLDRTGKFFMNQTTYQLEVRPAEGLIADGPDTVYVGQLAKYSAESSKIEGCVLNSFEWQWSDGVNFRGTRMQRTFTKVGTYKLQLSAGGNLPDVPRACSGCVSREIVVMPRAWRKPTARIDSLREAWTAKAATPITASQPCTLQEPEQLCFSFTDDGEALSDTLPFIYRWDLGDGTLKEGATVEHCYNWPGAYNVKLEILDPISRQQIATRNDYVLDVKDMRQVFVESYDTVALGDALRLNAFQSDFPGCNVQSVAWSLGDGTTQNGPEVSHVYAREGTYRVQMALEGVDMHNGQSCSRCAFKEVLVVNGKTFNAVRDSLRDASIVDRPHETQPDGKILLEVTKEGYEKHVIALDPNDPKGVVVDSMYMAQEEKGAVARVKVRDEATGMALRQVSVVVQEIQSGATIGEYMLADSNSTLPLTPGIGYRLLIRKEGFLTEVMEIPMVKASKAPIDLALTLPKAEVGLSWVIHNLYYDFDKSHIRTDAAIELTKLAVFLRANPTLVVELGSHTDVRGSDAYNLRLSQARAESAVAFLLARGVNGRRIVARGYGEQRLANACADGVACSEAAHQENRRTEITVLGFKDPIYSQARPVEEIWSTESIMIPTTTKSAPPFTILLGTYIEPQPANRFDRLGIPVKRSEVDGFWCYSYGDYGNYASALANLESVRQRGFPHASILAAPGWTQPDPLRIPEPASSAQPVELVSQAKPMAQPTRATSADAAATVRPGEPGGETYYAIQLASSSQPAPKQFIAQLGSYAAAVHDEVVEGRHVLLVGRYATEAEARSNLTNLHAQGQPRAFLVKMVDGKKTNLNSTPRP